MVYQRFNAAAMHCIINMQNAAAPLGAHAALCVTTKFAPPHVTEQARGYASLRDLCWIV